MKTDVEKLMHRIDAAQTASELASLQLEVQTLYQQLPDADRADFVTEFTERVRARAQSVSDKLADLEKARVNA